MQASRVLGRTLAALTALVACVAVACGGSRGSGDAHLLVAYPDGLSDVGLDGAVRGVVAAASKAAAPTSPAVDGRQPLVLFEAVGVMGMLDRLMRDAPRGSRIVVVGVCMQQDQIWPMVGIGKELNLQFVLGYEPAEFTRTLQLIADGQIDVGPLITAEVGITEVPAAFQMLATPDAHAKILVVPALGRL